MIRDYIKGDYSDVLDKLQSIFDRTAITMYYISAVCSNIYLIEVSLSIIKLMNICNMEFIMLPEGLAYSRRFVRPPVYPSVWPLFFVRDKYFEKKEVSI
jgi:hypothetical protein